MNTSVLDRQTGRRWAVVTAVAGTVFIAAGAFWLSFTALADLAARSGVAVGQAWAWPLIVDGIIVVATVAVVALAGQKAAWYPWCLLIGGAAVSVTANAIHAVVGADADVPGVLAASVAAVPPVVLLAITHLTVILTRPVQAADRADATTGDRRASVLAPAIPDDSAAAQPSLTHPVTAAALEEAMPAESPEPVRDTGAVPAGVRRARAAELRGLGWSNKRIAREMNVHPSTVGRWFAGVHPPGTTEIREETNR